MKASNLIMLFVASCMAISANAPDYSTMLVAPMEVTAPAVPTVSLNGHCEKVGEYRCIDGYKIMECGTSNKWEQRICPGGCDSDATFAHCLMPKFEAASIAGRNDAQCTPKSRACDSARRFVFECNDDGHWNEGNQCNRAGACNVSGEWGLVCTGHPRFYYDDNRVCERERSCELMAYKNCLAATTGRNPKKEAECLAYMCRMEDCRDCDRCSFKLAPGQQIVPDLSTLWHSG